MRFAGLGAHLRLALRRDRWRLPLTALALGVWLWLMAAGLVGVYPDAASRAGAALTLDNPGSTFLVGRIYHAHDYHWGVMIGHETLVLLTVATGLVAALTVVRHSRAEEETGRAELLRAGPVGRHALLAAAVLMALLTLAVLMVTVVLTLLAVGEDVVDLPGSLTYAAATTSVGLVLTGVAALTAQLVPTARAASGLAGAVLAAAFLVRGVADTTEGLAWLSWLSPIGWAQQTYPFDRDRWWPLLVPLAVTVVLLALAALLSTRRDLGAALRPERAGRRAARHTLLNPVGLVTRLSRGLLVGWGVGLAVFGVVYGPVLGEAEKFLDQMPVLEDMLPAGTGAGGVRLFAGIVLSLAALVATVPAVQVLTRLVRDEQAGRTATLLANGPGRLAWYAAHVAVAVFTAVVGLVAFGVTFGATAWRETGERDLLGDIVVGALGQLAPAALVVGVAALLAGWAPRAVGLVWVVVALGTVVLYFAEILDWPAWVADLSPWHHVAARPAEQGGDAVAQLVLWGAAAVLVVVGAVGYRRRAVAG